MISPIDRQRIQYINNLMDNLHNKLNDLYESLVDREFNDIESTSAEIIDELNLLIESIKDEL